MNRFIISAVCLCYSLLNFGIPESVDAQGFSGVMTLNCSDHSPVPSIFPVATPVNYSVDPFTEQCTVQFAGLTCLGKSSGGVCQFGSEDCGGPEGWICSVYERGIEEGYGSVWYIRCRFPGDPLLDFSYSAGTSPDILGFNIKVQ